MYLCAYCFSCGYCRKLNSRIVTDQELSDPVFVRDVKSFARSLGCAAGDWRERLYNLYRDYPGRIVNTSGEEVFLDLEEIETDHFREWVRDFMRPVPASAKPRVRREAHERVRVIASILRAAFPKEAMMWGVRGDNDNDPLEPV